MDPKTVRSRRRAIGLTQRQLGLYIGLSAAWVEEAEAGRKRILPEHARRLSAVLTILESAHHAARTIGARSVA